jgi:hypothetical protein
MVIASIVVFEVRHVQSEAAQETRQLESALVPQGSDQLVSTQSSEVPVRMGTVLDVNMGQLQSYDHHDVRLISITPHSASRNLRVIGSFFADLCGSRADAYPPILGFEEPITGVRTYYKYSIPTHPITVQTVAEYNRLYTKLAKIPGHCHYLPTWLWVIRLTAKVPGRYRWQGLIAKYTVDGRVMKEVLPQVGYDITWSNCAANYEGKNRSLSYLCSKGK